jgi:hypothetical protein
VYLKLNVNYLNRLGFASDLEFFGGGTAWEFGNQQFTATNIVIKDAR